MHITVSEYGLICALPILSAGVNDTGRLFKCFSPLTLYPLALSFVPFSKALPLTATHIVLLIWQIFCFSLYVTAAIFYGCVVIWCLCRTIFISEVSLSGEANITVTKISMHILVYNTHHSPFHSLRLQHEFYCKWSITCHRVLFISMLTNTCVVDNFVFKHLSNDLCLIFLYKALLLRMQ